jgi:hypothetical protein
MTMSSARGLSARPMIWLTGARAVGVGGVEEPDPVIYRSALHLDRAVHIVRQSDDALSR